MGTPWPPRGPDDLDEQRRARIRREVLARVETRGPGFGDHLYAVLSVLAVPAPYIVRAAVTAVLVISLVATASVASADALPEEPLYGLKVASEQVRLALAQTPVDRAAVWLSMAEHRLAEAEGLALAGREPEALVAASAYGTQLAEAAAELASIERLEAIGPSIVARLRERLDDQQARAADIAERLRAGTASAQSAPTFDTVASAPPAEASGTISELIAEHAASVTDQVAAAAEQRAEDEGVSNESAPAEVAAAPEPPAPAPAQRRAVPAPRPQGVGSVTLPDPTPASAPTAAGEPREDQGRSGEGPGDGEGVGDSEDKDDDEDAKGTAKPKRSPSTLEKLAEISQQWKAALEKIKHEQQKAREAQKKAKERGKKTPEPVGQRSRHGDGDRGSSKDKRGGERERHGDD